MKNISVLDVTLRDGGYCNDWRFGTENIVNIINSLSGAGIDYIECGYISNKAQSTEGRTIYQNFEELHKCLSTNNWEESVYLAMINYGDVPLEHIPPYNGFGVEALRIAFRKKHWKEAVAYCKEIKNKGYKVFVQPMASGTYTDQEFKNLIYAANKIHPYAFYIVDSFGSMTEQKLARLFSIADQELHGEIFLGFHAHNNMQLAYSNAQWFVNFPTVRKRIIDSSIMGMGRGAGNLNTELFINYINENCKGTYLLKPLLYIIDAVINNFYSSSPWGYSLPNYLSAKHNIHPKYALYLCEKNTLRIDDINEIFRHLDDEKKEEFDKNYMDNLYLKHMMREQCADEHFNEFRQHIQGKIILLLASGPNITVQEDRIKSMAQQENVITISVNYHYKNCPVDYVFFSNRKRYSQSVQEIESAKIIITSNISSDDYYLQVDYGSLINNVDYVNDNAGLMAIQFLLSLGVKEIYLAGFDGFSHDVYKNYANKKMALCIPENMADAINEGMRIVLRSYLKQASITSLTQTHLL